MGQDIFSNHHTPPGLLNETHLLTGVLSFEVANETDVFLHPLEGPQLHGIIDHFHWVLQHLWGQCHSYHCIIHQFLLVIISFTCICVKM